MNDKSLKKLEYDKIIDKLIECCSSSLGKKIAMELRPLVNKSGVQELLEQTTEAREIWRLYPMVPLGGIKDIRQILHKVKIGGVLAPDMLLDINSTLYAANQLHRFCANLSEKYFHIKGLGKGLTLLNKLEAEINRCIHPEGEVADQASSELGHIRSSMRQKQGQVREKLDSIVRSITMQKYLQDPIVTIRNDRYVVPVKVEYRGQVPGLLHDQSSSGATLFIEPMAVVELNNQLRHLEIREEQEIQRILAELTQQVAVYLPELAENIEILAQLDFIFAKGKLSQKMDAWAPALNEDGVIRINQGRHPLITGAVVPTTVELGEKFDILVITGPNTGGKTVTLKTVGLFVLMTQSGLHIPCEDQSTMGIFEQVFVDIGDEQSIEQSLSTFSSHMNNIIDILHSLTPNSLVLMDELGAGTDPTEGSALAMSILDHLLVHGVKTIATTHYSELKAFAYANQRVENASVEFDSISLKPTYKLLIGIPGRSNAFEISQRLGLPTNIIDKARDFLSKEEVKVADLIKNLEENQMLSDRARDDAQLLKEEVAKQLDKLKNKELQLKNQENAIISEAHKQAAKILADAKSAANDLLKEIREARNKVGAEQERIAMQAREKLTKLRDKTLEDLDENVGQIAGAVPKGIRPGALVHLPKYNQKGQVLTEPNSNGEVQVQAGILKIMVKIDEIRLIDEKKIEKGQSVHGHLAKSKAQNIKTEIDLRGCLVDDAMYQLEKYLDDALVAGLPMVRIIHGKGTGALRQAIREFLKEASYIKSYRLGAVDEGGNGVTIIEI